MALVISCLVSLAGCAAPAPVAPSAPAAAPAAVASPITVGVIDRSTPAGPVRGHWATVDLRDPRVEIIVTAPVPASVTRNGQPVQAVLTPTDVWAKQTNVDLAINANFFGHAGKLPPAPPTLPPAKPGESPSPDQWHSGAAANIIGLCISDGVTIAPVRVHKDRPDPAIIFLREAGTPGLRARAGYIDAKSAQGALAAVAGVGGSETDTVAGTLLVEGGKNLGASARVQPGVRHPRTAIGTSADGRTLILVVVDGRQPTHSIGLTLPELADEMIARGATDAVALDGGGSSAFVHRGTNAAPTLNKPSDGAFRAVAVNLGIRLKPATPAGASGGR